MIDNTQGDPKIFINENGAYLKWVNGQPIMDAGIENIATISLLTAENWWGNDLWPNPDNKAGSDFEEVSRQPITLTSLVDVEQSAEKALENQAFGEVVAEVSNPRASGLDFVARVSPPGSDSQTFALTRNFQNWVNQASDPAYVKQ